MEMGISVLIAIYTPVYSVLKIDLRRGGTSCSYKNYQSVSPKSVGGINV